MIHAVVFQSSQNQRILLYSWEYSDQVPVWIGGQRVLLADNLFMAPTNTSILNFMGPDALSSVASHIDLPTKRALIFRGKHPPSCGTTTIRARKSPLKKRNRPAAAGLRLW
jgi:hypothetical protein